ncbi:MAG TPA: ATP-binding protein [Polyangiaceae bacterium]|nr:ATP-binding protein [Polyangiaceae bacterium]
MNLEAMSREELLAELRALLQKEQERTETDRAVHELRVHQVELELQNRELREAQGALEQSRARFEELYDFAPVAYYTFDPLGVIREVNLTGASMIGRDRTALIGQPFVALVKLDEPEIFFGHLRRCAAARRPTVTEMCFSTPRHPELSVQVVSVPILDVAGKPMAFRTAFSDISRLKQTEAELKRTRDAEVGLRSRFEALDTFSLRLNQLLIESGRRYTPSDALLQEVVDQARRGCQAEYAALGIGKDPTRPFDRWVFSGLPVELASLLGRRPSPSGILGEVIHGGRALRLRDLREHPGFRGFPPHHPVMRSFLGVVIPDGGNPVGHLYLTNKLSADEFSKDDQDFAEMIAQRAGAVIEIGRLNSELNAALSARDNVLAIVSHDLGNSLAVIQLAAKVCSAAAHKDEATSKSVDLILRASETMKRLIDDLLHVGTMDAGRFTLERRDEALAPIVEQAVQQLTPLAAAKSVHLEREIPDGLPPIHCDRVRLIQVLSNLIGNAVKFAPNGGAVGVRAWIEAGEFRFAISDNGPGIAEGQVPHLFERYWTGGAHGRHGVGLGLHIAKHIVEAHGGRIWVESRPGEGSTFFFAIPVEPP